MEGGRRDGDAAKHVGFELEKGLRGARKRETDKNGDRKTEKPMLEMYKVKQYFPQPTVLFQKW